MSSGGDDVVDGDDGEDSGGDGIPTTTERVYNSESDLVYRKGESGQSDYQEWAA